MTRILLNGAATLVGAEVLRALLARRDVVVMLADARGIHRLERYLGVSPLPLAAGAYDVVINCSSEDWLDRLERKPSLRLVQLSTTFVGGTRRGLFTEFDLDLGQQFHNASERSCFAMEQRLRASQASGRITIVRASHTLGRAATGDAFDLGGAYPLLSALASSSLLGGDARARIDFVPADYVAAATVALAISGTGGTFHLASGWDASIPVRNAAALAAHTHGRRRGALLLPRAIAWRNPAYFYQGPVFDTFLTERFGFKPPRVESWLETVTKVAEERAWKAPRAFEESAGNVGREVRLWQ